LSIWWWAKLSRENSCKSGLPRLRDAKHIGRGKPLLQRHFSLLIEIVTFDDYFIVVNKQSGLLSVPGRGPDKADCLSARVQAEFPEALVVHRLDMETSGLMVFARNLDAQRALNRAFEQRHVEKEYVAVVTGVIQNDHGTIDLPLICDWPNRPRQMVDHTLGKPSTTHYVVLASDKSIMQTRVGLTPITGRSHQLRVHMASLGHAIVGDSLYSVTPPPEGQRLLLHAAKLSFPHPVTSEPVACASDVPF
jgi:tRNA pseudouridine32 synthase / 23S rRNA pseudouridine746 synthase